jgi:outer membrane protein TolC
LKDVQALVRGGALARVEEMRADAQVAAARVALARAQGNVAVAQTALRVLLNVEGDGEFAITEDLTQSLPEVGRTKRQLLDTALANRSELKAMRAMREVHDSTLDAENGAKLPKLNLTGLAELSNPNQRVDPFTREFKPSWQVGAVLSWSPNDFFVADKRANRVAADRSVTETDIRLLELALRGEVDQAYEDFVASREAQTQALSGIAAAEETYRVRREQFRAGSVVATEVIQAETELRKARLELVSAAIDARIASARIDRAIEAKR